MAKNGEINKIFGIYRTLCCGQAIIIVAGMTFPDCPRHPKLTTEWKLIVDGEGIIHLSGKSAKKPKPAA